MSGRRLHEIRAARFIRIVESDREFGPVEVLVPEPREFISTLHIHAVGLLWQAAASAARVTVAILGRFRSALP